MGRPSKQTLPKTLQIRSSTQYRVFNSSPFFITRFPSLIKLFTSSVVELSFLLQLGQPFSFFLSISYMEIVSIDLRSSFSSIHTSCLFYSHPLSVRLHAFILIALFLTFFGFFLFLEIFKSRKLSLVTSSHDETCESNWVWWIAESKWSCIALEVRRRGGGGQCFAKILATST